jgi:hypothetical protein
MKEVDGKPKNCGPVAHRLRESIASPIVAIPYARGCPRGILALLPAAVGPVAQLEILRTAQMRRYSLAVGFLLLDDCLGDPLQAVFLSVHSNVPIFS